jgi:hypothetical protein
VAERKGQLKDGREIREEEEGERIKRKKRGA